MRFVAFLLICLLGFSACDIQRRHFRNGFYFAHSEAKGEPKTIIKNTAFPFPQSASHSPTNQKLISTDCDTLILKNGTTIVCTIVGIRKRKIEIKNCGGNISYRAFIPRKTIQSARGLKGQFDLNSNITEPTKYLSLAIACGIFALIGLALVIYGFIGMSMPGIASFLNQLKFWTGIGLEGLAALGSVRTILGTETGDTARIVSIVVLILCILPPLIIFLFLM